MIANLKKEIVSFLTKLANSLVFFMAIVFLALASIIYLGFGTSARATLIEQMLHREQVIARSGASSIEGFLTLFGRSITILEETSLTQAELDIFVNRWKDSPVTGVVLTDASGEIIVNSNRTKESGVGTNVSDRDYFIWSKTAKDGEVFISSPVISRVGTTKGKYIVLVATPVIRENKFQGVMAGSVLLPELSEYYLNSLKISEGTRIYLLDQDGVILASARQQLIGINYINYLNSEPFLGAKAAAPSLKRALEDKDEGKIDIVLQEETNKILTRYLIAYTPIKTDGEERHWVLAVATPVDDALIYMGPIFARQIVAMVLVFLAVLALGIRLAKVIAYREAKAKLQK